VSVGIPSISSAQKSKTLGYYVYEIMDEETGKIITKYVRISTHDQSWMEIGANKEAAKYFKKIRSYLGRAISNRKIILRIPYSIFK